MRNYVTQTEVNEFRQVFTATAIPNAATLGTSWLDLTGADGVVFICNVGAVFNNITVEVLANGTQSATGATVVTDTISTFVATTSANSIGIIELTTDQIPTANGAVNNNFVNLRVTPAGSGTIPYFGAVAYVYGNKYTADVSNAVSTANRIGFITTDVAES